MRGPHAWMVLVQFALLLLLLLPGEPLWSTPIVTVIAVILGLSGLAVSITGIAALGRDIVPWVAPKPGAPLRTTGVYRYTRNPIYLGLIVASAGWVLWRARIELIVVWLLLTVLLVAKAHVEQRYLRAAFGSAYLDYAARTPLVLPGRRRG